MLINTVILLLRDGLPIVLMWSLLLLTTNNYVAHTKTKVNQQNFRQNIQPIDIDPIKEESQRYYWLITAIFISIILTSILVFCLATISQFFEGKGIELLFSFIFISVYFSIVFHLFCVIKKTSQHWVFASAMLSFTLLICVNASNFSLYFTQFWSQSLLPALLIGLILGTGICISIAILLYFSLRLIPKYYQNFSIYLLLLFFGCGQLNQAIDLLLQIDVLPSYPSLWDSSFLVNENKELGYFLMALLGYEATPSLLHVVIYGGALLLPISCFFTYQKFTTYQQIGKLNENA